MHIGSFVNIQNLLEQINKYNTKKLANENMYNIKIEKEKQIEKLNNLKRGLYEDWKNDYITKEEYLEYKQKYEQDAEKIRQTMANLKKQKEKQEETINGNNKWIENFKVHKNITKLDRDIITELIDYIEVHEDKKITIHFKFMNDFNKILEYIEK